MERRLLVCVLLLATLSRQGLSKESDDSTTDGGEKTDSCRLNSVRLIIEDQVDSDQQMKKNLTVQFCASNQWKYFCHGKLSRRDEDIGLTNCEHEEDLMWYVCKFERHRRKTIKSCLLKQCIPSCLAADSTTTTTATTTAPPSSTSLKQSPTVSTSETKTTMSETLASFTDIPSIMVGNIIADNKLITILGSAIGGLFVVIIVVLIVLVLVIVAVYMKTRKRENLSIARCRDNTSGDAHSESELNRYQQTVSLGNTIQNVHHETDPYYESPKRWYKDNAQPTDYEQFHPSTSTTSNVPLINEDPQPYEVLVGSVGGIGVAIDGGKTDSLYETIKDAKDFKPQNGDGDQENNSDSVNHIYFTLEPGSQ